MHVKVCVSLEYHIRRPFEEIRIWNTMSGGQPMGRVGLGALHLLIPIPKLWTRALVRLVLP